MEILVVLYIIFAHWVSDFIFQDEQWALNKSKNNFELFKHVATYSFIMFLFIWWLTFNFYHSIVFMAFTGIAHFITDYITSRHVSKQFARNHMGSSIPNLGAFTSIGFDQVLHYVQLFLTYEILFV